jgi:hypothetical protein
MYYEQCCSATSIINQQQISHNTETEAQHQQHYSCKLRKQTTGKMSSLLNRVALAGRSCGIVFRRPTPSLTVTSARCFSGSAREKLKAVMEDYRKKKWVATCTRTNTTCTRTNCSQYLSLAKKNGMIAWFFSFAFFFVINEEKKKLTMTCSPFSMPVIFDNDNNNDRWFNAI